MSLEEDRVATIAAATEVAKEVARTAAATAAEVTKTAEKTANSVLLLSQDLGYIKSDIKEIKDKLDNKFVTTEQLMAVKDNVTLLQKICFGSIASILGIVIARVLGKF